MLIVDKVAARFSRFPFCQVGIMSTVTKPIFIITSLSALSIGLASHGLLTHYNLVERSHGVCPVTEDYSDCAKMQDFRCMFGCVLGIVICKRMPGDEEDDEEEDEEDEEEASWQNQDVEYSDDEDFFDESEFSDDEEDFTHDEEFVGDDLLACTRALPILSACLW